MLNRLPVLVALLIVSGGRMPLPMLLGSILHDSGCGLVPRSTPFEICGVVWG